MKINKINYSPYTINGRWYKIFIETSGSSISITTSDISNAEISDGSVKLPAGFNVVSVNADIHFYDDVAKADAYAPKIYHNNGNDLITLPSAGYDYATVFVYGYEEE